MNVIYNNKIMLKDIVVANSFWSRFSGYMLRKKPHVSGILFVTSGSMQTTFMNFDLDIIFLDKDNKILKKLTNVKPWRITKIYKGTKRVLEVPAGFISEKIKEGEHVEFSKD